MVFRAGDRLTNRPYEIKKEVGMDYTSLRDLLAAGKWKKANWETGQVILRAANREKEGWLRYEDIEKFPKTDFRTMDDLWVEYSSGCFGFSVQKRIWEKLGGTKEWDDGIAKNWGVAIGWRREESWINYKRM
ncbi:MAG: GUN4 domain-containing protein [Prochloron sp. SP5CPC1]|nr:GUN4 domain-containing protein [Candidatus Paraprochloron terpiosi SP5CPC1]